MDVFDFENSTRDSTALYLVMSSLKIQIETSDINTMIIWKKPRVTYGNENEGESPEFNLFVYL